MNKKCFYQSGKIGIIDLVGDDGRSEVNGETLEEIRLRYPGADIGDADAIYESWRKSFISGVQEITKEKYLYALEVLPPLQWRADADGESFKTSELTFADITAIYAKRGNKYYTLFDSVRTPHAEIMHRVLQIEGRAGK